MVLLFWCLESLQDLLSSLFNLFPKGDHSWVFIGRIDAEAETPILWPPDAKSWLIGKDPDAGKDWEQEEKGTTEAEMAGWHHRLYGHEFGWAPGAGDGQGGLACCGSWGHKELDTTERLNWTELNFSQLYFRVWGTKPWAIMGNLAYADALCAGGHWAASMCMFSWWRLSQQRGSGCCDVVPRPGYAWTVAFHLATAQLWGFSSHSDIWMCHLDFSMFLIIFRWSPKLN